MSQSTRTPTGGVSASVLIIVLVGLARSSGLSPRIASVRTASIRSKSAISGIDAATARNRSRCQHALEL
jgi:hypothetical protein